MAKINIQHLPLSFEEVKKVSGKSGLLDLILFTGARISEAKKVIDTYKDGSTYVDITTKGTGTKINRIELLPEAIEAISRCDNLKDKEITSHYNEIIRIRNITNLSFTAHNIRATFGTNLIENGVDLVTVSTLMNHANVEQTAQYIKVSELTKSNALKTLQPFNTIQGMTQPEMMKEIIRLRRRLTRMENKYANI